MTAAHRARAVVAALIAALVVILGAATVSAATTPSAETRVRASVEPAQVLVGHSEHIAAGQRLGNHGSRPGIVVATGVAAKTETELVQRWMSQAELEATRSTGLVRGGREGTHYVTDFANHDPLRARQRLALPQTPEVRVQLEVPRGVFSPPKTVRPDLQHAGRWARANSDRAGPMSGGVRMGLNPGTALRLEISDPFELSQILECEVISVDSFVSGASVETVLVRPSTSLEWQGRRYDYIAVRGRQSPGIVDELVLGQTIECSGFGVSETYCTSTASQAFEGWRGGLAVRANAMLT